MYKIVNPIEEDGTINLNCSASNDNWLLAARLLKAVKKGDNEAAAKLKAMDDDLMVEKEQAK